VSSNGHENFAPAYPRPQMRRSAWVCLNGEWEFAINAKADWQVPAEATFDRKIIVPFSPETKASGVHETGFYSAVWYRRIFEAAHPGPDRRLMLHFEAVDYRTIVWVNGKRVGSHQGGYTPFHFDITDVLNPDGQQEIVIRAEDDPADLAKPRGKQDWKLEPHSIWYPRTTGIWQTVWMETVPETHIHSIAWSSSLDRWDIGLEAAINSKLAQKPTLYVRLTLGDHVLASDSYEVVAGEVHRRIALSDPGIDDYRNELLWSPQSPTLIEAELVLRDEAGNVIDEVQSYTALRSVGIQGDRVILNGRPLKLRLVLDQGYWPDSGMTAPNDSALLQDVALTKQMGFNGVRKHQKVECERYLYWADRIGLLVWEEMPSAYRYTKKSIERVTHEWVEVINRDRSHPSIIAWVPFNESWGVPDLPDNPAHRHYVQGVYHLTKALDASRPVVGNDGWESIATDLIGIHDYDDQPERIGKRYGIDHVEAHLLKRERPGGRMLMVEGEPKSNQPIVLTEFGGIAYSNNHRETWGYSRSETAQQFRDRYAALLEVIRNLPALAGFCYTQLTDTYQEANGLLFADRTPKIPLEEIALATTGSLPDFDINAEAIWREHIMQQS